MRQFGQVFGNTTYSAALVVAVFMLGLGVGSYLLGRWSDARHRIGRGLADQLLAYACLEGVVAGLGLLVSLALPALAAAVAGWSAYVTDDVGWHGLSLGSYLARALLTVGLLGPITFAMGGTLTVLVRSVAHAGPRQSGWAIALLYGANTLGAAAGAFVTDFLLVPSVGVRTTQVAAVALNLLAGAGALFLVRRSSFPATAPPAASAGAGDHSSSEARALPFTALALALSGFAALGFEILWLRHLGAMLGAFRAVFSLTLTVMLVSLGAGALVGGWLDRRFARPAALLMCVQGAFAAVALLGLGLADGGAIAARSATAVASVVAASASGRLWLELWFNLRPMILEVALPSFVGGFAFPLANALVQQSEGAVGRRAGALYLANTVGAVCGSVTCGFVLLPWLGMQGTTLVLAATAALAIAPLYLVQRRQSDEPRTRGAAAWAAVVAATASAAWAFLPPDHLVRRVLGPRDAGERIVAVSESVDELAAVVEVEGRGRGLLTNGHAMSSTARLDQRYMRALAHVPLLAMDAPASVLVIGFGVGNTTHAATLHRSVTRVDVADVSRGVLGLAGYFADANDSVLSSPKVRVFVNDGRTHLQMTAPATYDLITLEPPPITHAGVAALYSRQFYELAHSRLTPGGYVSQWLPAYQVPAEASLSMVRSFIDVFPQSVLLSGQQAELILLGTTGPRALIDPHRVQAVLAAQPGVQNDLAAVDLGSPREIAATFVASADTLQRAAAESPAAVDDLPIQEYGVSSRVTSGAMGVPASLFDLTAAHSWCPACYEEGNVTPVVAGLDLHFAMLQQAYLAPPAAVAAVVGRSFGERRILNSAYLGSVVPDSAEVHNVLGVAASRAGNEGEAVREFEAALARDANSTNARRNLSSIRSQQAAALMTRSRFADAVPLLRAAVDLVPDDHEALNDLGVALASLGSVAEAARFFERAVSVAPDFEEARANLAAARSVLGR